MSTSFFLLRGWRRVDHRAARLVHSLTPTAWARGATALLALSLATVPQLAFAGFSTATGTSASLPAPGAASRMAFGDFNNDGRVDVFYQTGANGTAWAYGQGNADGTFTVTTSTAATGAFTSSTSTPFNGVTQFDFTGTGAALITGDFNGDGRTDIWFTANGIAGTILWNGASGFTSAAAGTSPYNFPAVGAPSRLVAGDFDNDGITDLFYQTGGNGTAWAFAKGTNTGTFTIYTSTNATGVFANATSTPFNGVTQFDFTGTGSILRAGDFNGDGKTDIWWHLNSGAGTVLWGGASTFTSASAATYNFPAVGATSRLVTGDFNSDGKDDLFYQTGANGTAWAYAQGSSSGTFTVFTSTSATGAFANASSTPFNGVTQFDFTGTGAILVRGDITGDLDDDFWFLINGSAGTVFTQNGSPPRLSSTTPADNATNISTTTSIVLTFDQTVAKGSAGNITVKKTSDNSTAATIAVTSGSVTGSGATWTVATGVTLATSTSYYVLIDAGAFVNTNGQYHTGIATTTALNFTTVPPAPVISSSLTASGTYRSAISTYTITATNSPTSYSASGLPAGLSVNTTNGQITGTPTTSGSFNVTIGATNAGGTGTATLVITIAKVGLTVSGVTANDKVYSATTAATLNVGSAALVGVLGGDTVTLNTGSASGVFATATVGSGKTVTISGLSISGTSSGNYTLTQPTATAAITAKALTVAGLTAANKTYDALVAASLSGTAALLTAESPGTGTAVDGKPFTGDTVSLTGTPSGAFADRNVGSNKTVTVSGLSLSGAQAGNYSLTAPTPTATISAKALTASGVAGVDKIYDAQVAATLSGTAALSTAEGPGAGTTSDGKPYTGDTVSLTGTPSGAFADRHVGSGKTITVSGLSLSGAQAGNYSLTAPTPTATISAKALTASGLTAVDKIYDAQVTATLSGTAALLTAENPGVGTTNDGKPYTGDTVSLTGTPSGAFADRHAGSGKTVTVSGLSLGGAQVGNYSLTAPTPTATISAKALTASGLTATDKIYDALTTATLSGTAALLTAESPGAGTTSDGTPYTGDTVSLTGTPSGSFADRHAGSGKVVTVSGLSLSGAQAGNYSVTAPAPTATISAKALTASGLAASGKTYDASTAATLSGTAALQAAESPGGSTGDGKPYTGDTVSLSGTPSGAFATRQVGPNKPVSVSGLSLSGAQAGNYALSAITGLTADITAATLTIVNVTANNKVYDATTAATLNTGTAALSGVLGTDVVTLSTSSASGTFATKIIGTAKPVTTAGFSISGADSGNYVLTQPATTANITAASLSITGVTANNKVYDATTAATLNTASAALSGVLGSDSVTLNASGAAGVFATKTVGNAKPVAVTGFAIGGADAGNYTLTQPSGTANITAAGLSVTGITASNKVYDATTAATLSTGSAALSGVLGTDVVTLDVSGATGAFATKVVGSGKTVTISGVSIGGADSGNYALTQPATTANITPAGLTVAGVTASDKVYNANTAATLDTSGASLSGVLSGDTVTLDATSVVGTFDTKNVGTGKTVTVAGLGLSGADAGNYTLAQPTALAAITPKGLTVTADDKSRGYGAANPTLTATISGFAGGETVSVLTGAASLATSATSASLPGTYPITVAAGTLAANNSNYTFSFVAGTLTITATTYADWKAQEFTPSEQADAAISGPGADPDEDGIINLLEYALALHPKIPDRTGLPIIGTVSESGSTYAAITYPRRVGASDLSYAVQASADLSTWSSTGVVELGAVDLGATEGVNTRDGSALGTGSHRFLRLQVTLTSGPQVAATDPLGAVALTVDGAGSASNARPNLLGLPLTAPVVYQGRISSVSGSTLVQSISNWADDAFNGAAGSYFLEIASGTNAGLTLDITATSAASHSLTAVSAIDTYASAGDTFKVRRHLTLTDVFGATNSAGLVAGTLTTADLVQAYLPGTQTYVSYYYQNSGAGGTGWRTSASTSVDAAQTPLYFDEGLLVRKQTGPLTWILTGAVKTGPTIFAVSPGLNYLPNVYPAGSLTLGGCQIYTGSAATGLAGGTVTTADLIDILNVSQGVYTNYYYRTVGLGGTGWRANTSISANAAGTEIPIGASVHLQRKASGTFLWHVPQPF